MALTILAIGALVFCGHLFAAVFRQTQLPDVLVLMVLGFLIGPNVLGWVHPEDFGKVGPVFTTVALLVILFEGGVNLPLATLRKALAPTLRLTVSTAGGTALISFFAILPIVHDWRLAVLFGVIAAAISSSVIIPLLRGLPLSEPMRATLLLESVLTDVLAVVCTYGLVQAIHVDRVHMPALFMHLSYALLVGVLIGAVGGVVWRVLLSQVRRFPNTLFTEFAFVFVLYGLAELADASGPTAALVFGIAALNLSAEQLRRVPLLRRVPVEQISPVQFDVFAEAVFLTKVFFFVFLGLSLRMSHPRVLGFSLAVVLGSFLVRAVVCRLMLPRRVPRRDAVLASVLVPKGLTAAVLASVPAQQGVPYGDLVREIVFNIVFLSIVLTSVLVPLVLRTPLGRWMERAYGSFAEEATPTSETVIVEATAPA